MSANGAWGDNGAWDPVPGAELVDGAHDHIAELTAVLDTVLRLLSGLPRPPTRLRVQVSEVTLELGWGAPASTSPPLSPPPVPEPAGVGRPGAAEAPPVTGTALLEPVIDHLHAPTVGTFYVAPEPGAPPFVEPGSLVMPGQQVGIVEVMKLMIPVEADRHCRIVQLLVADASPVEFGQRLFVIAPVVPA